MEASQAILLAAFMETPVDSPDDALTSLLARLGPRRATKFAWSVRDFMRDLSDDQIEHLARLFTLMENAAPREYGFCGGSTTAVPYLVAELERRDPARGVLFIDWALCVAKNPYNPFGTYNQSRLRARSASEYRALERARFKAIHAIESERSEAAKLRRMNRATRHATREAAHREANLARRALIAELERLSPVERLRRLAMDNGIRIGAIPAEYACIEAALALEQPLRESLLHRLRWAPRGQWRAVRNALALQTGPSEVAGESGAEQ